MLCRVGHLSHTMHVLKKCHIVVSQPTWVSHILPLNYLSILNNEVRLQNLKILGQTTPGPLNGLSSEHGPLH